MPELCEECKEKDIIMNVRHKTGEINVKISVWGKQNYNWYWIFFCRCVNVAPTCCTGWWNKSHANIWKLLGRENRLKIVLFGSLHLTASAMKFVCAGEGSASEGREAVDVAAGMVGVMFHATTCTFFKFTEVSRFENWINFYRLSFRSKSRQDAVHGACMENFQLH